MASKIAVSDLLADFRRMLDEKWKYVASAAEQGKVDCSGAFVWSYKQHGCSIYHGSNRIARDEVDKLYPIGSVQVVPGMSAFKHRTPLDSGYALPASYKSGGSNYNGDLNDYYHIGLVDEDTARVLNAQSASTGFVSSKISQGWTHIAYLKQVDYGMKNIEESSNKQVDNTNNSVDNNSTRFTYCTATIYAENGKGVNLRIKPSTSATKLEQLKVGTKVDVTGYSEGEWTPVSYNGKSGYIMTEFLKIDMNSENVQTSQEEYSSYACIFYDLTYEQAVNLKSEISKFRSYIEGRNG